MSWMPWDDFQMDRCLSSPSIINQQLTSDEIQAGRLDYRVEVIEMMTRLGMDTQNNDLIESYIDDPDELIRRDVEYFSARSEHHRACLFSEALGRIKEGAKYRASLGYLERD